MTVEEMRGGHGDQFPVGMRVLAVDDDPVCLKLLESLLIRCQYNVTTTSQAITALRLLRENKNKFDLVISDVHMPDMDGFKLLELVGLEMDLPVIMLSANGEKQAVMKGITHGACDYLLKPVRIEELKNIWQHVIRRRKFDKRSQKNNDDANTLDNGEDGQKAQIINSAGGQRVTDRSGKLNKRRKDQNDEDDEFDSEDDMQENDENSSQKKPRVVWTVELHRKFVSAVNQLGIDKAVPRKVLDLMDVEKLTRENVASHLQKYRLYLKRLSIVNQQANLAASFGSRNSPITSLNGYRGYQALGGSKQSPILSSFQPNGLLGQVNTQASIVMQGLLPSQAIRLGGINTNTSYNLNETVKYHNLNLQRNDQTNLLHGVPTSLQLEGSQKPGTIQEVKSHLSTGSLNNGVTAAVCFSSLQNSANNSILMCESIQQQARELSNTSSVTVPASLSNSSGVHLQRVSQFPHVYGCNDTGQIAVAHTQHSVNMVSKLAPLKQENLTYMGVQNQSSFPASSRMNIPTGGVENPNFTNFRIDGVEENFVQKRTDLDHNSIPNVSAYTSFSNVRLNDATNQYQTPEQGLYNNSRIAANAINSTVLDTSLLAQNSEMNDSGTQLLGLDEFSTDTIGLHNGLNSTGCSFDELYAMIKQEQDDDKVVDGSDICYLGTCI